MSDWLEAQVPRIRELLDAHVDLLDEVRAAGRPLPDPERLAWDWNRHQGSLAWVEQWCAARCPDPEAAGLLTDLCVSPEMAAREATAGGVRDTIGFLVATGRLTDAEEIVAVAGSRALLLDVPAWEALSEREARARELAAAASDALEELAALLDAGWVRPKTARNVLHHLLGGAAASAASVDAIAASTFDALDGHLATMPRDPRPEVLAAELATALRAWARDALALHHRGRALDSAPEVLLSRFQLLVSVPDEPDGRRWQAYETLPPPRLGPRSWPDPEDPTS